MNFIKKQRKKLGYTQASLAEQTGLSLRTIQRLENATTPPKGHTLQELARVLEIDTTELQATFDEEKQTADEEKLSIQYINLAALAFLGIPFGNILMPFVVWRNRKTSPKVDEVAKRIINFQILWSLLFSFLLIIAPFLNGAFSSINLILYVLVIGMLINMMMILFIARRIQQNRFEFLNFYARFI